MVWLIIGLILWSDLHLIKALLPKAREQISLKLGVNTSKGLFALGILISLGLIIMGWRSTDPVPVFYASTVPLWFAAYVINFLAIYCLVSSSFNVRLKHWVRHPMLTGVILWGVAHLLVNGELRSLLLFGGMLIWAVCEIVFINKRDGDYEKPEPGGLVEEIKVLVVTIVVSAILVWLHPWIAGRYLALAF